MVWPIILWFIWGIVIGYTIFYFRYEHRNTVNELRSHLKEANKQLQYVQSEIDEHMQQNEILKEKVSDLLDKNEDLSQVTSELSKYYYHMKKASEKSKDLIKFLQAPDSAIEEKIQHYAKHTPTQSNPQEHKDFF